MNPIQALVKEYSSKKLKDIIENQSDSYNSDFIDYAKDELIKCGEIFKFNPELENRVKNLDDKTLQNLIDYDWVNYHLEYLELARIEYLKRGFKSDAKNGQASEPIQIKYLVKSYSILRSVIGVLKGLAIAGVIIALVFAFGMGTAISIPIIIQGILFAIGIFVFAESIKIIIKIEENTRK